MAHLYNYAYLKFQIGDTAYMTIRFRSHRIYNNESMYTMPIIESIWGSGAMYDHTMEFVLLERALGISNRLETITVEGDQFQVFAIGTIEQRNEKHVYGNTFDPSRYVDRTMDRWTIRIPDGITNIGSTDSYSFLGGWPLKGIILPDSIERIGDNAFIRTIGEDLGSDYTLVIPARCSYIGETAFQNNDCITTIDFSRNNILKAGNSFRYIGEYAFWQTSYINTTIILGNQELINDDWWYRRMHRNVTYVNPPHPNTYKYVCYDQTHGTQEFPLYETRQGVNDRAFNVYIDGQEKTLFLPMVAMEDTVNGGDRVQFVQGVGSMRFRKTQL